MADIGIIHGLSLSVQKFKSGKPVVIKADLSATTSEDGKCAVKVFETTDAKHLPLVIKTVTGPKEGFPELMEALGLDKTKDCSEGVTAVYYLKYTPADSKREKGKAKH